MMNGEISIRPSKDIRTNYAEVAITVNGREDTVLLSHADFLEQQRTIIELQERLAIYAELAQSQDDIKLGRVQSLRTAVKDIYKDIDNLKL